MLIILQFRFITIIMTINKKKYINGTIEFEVPDFFLKCRCSCNNQHHPISPYHHLNKRCLHSHCLGADQLVCGSTVVMTTRRCGLEDATASADPVSEAFFLLLKLIFSCCSRSMIAYLSTLLFLAKRSNFKFFHFFVRS